MSDLGGHNDGNLAARLASASDGVRATLEHALAGGEVSWQAAEALCRVTGEDFEALCATADRLRHEQAGDTVTYVVNRNINFTNVCVKACRFCAFSRTQRSEEGYFLDHQEIIRRVLEAQALGATEVCIQAGLAPDVDGRIYIDLCRAVKNAAPDIHVHAFSPEEVKYGAGLAGISIRQYLMELKDAGLGSLPGTSAEILDDEVRARIAPGRITTAEWMEVIRGAHELSLPTTSTIMFGHLESDGERVRHLDTLRTLQLQTGGFTEFVPLSFVHQEAPMFVKGYLAELRPGASTDEVVRLFAIARLMLGRSFRNIQVSWVKEGIERSKRILNCGANDLGGTLMNESISTAAGSSHGQFMSPKALRQAIRAVGRTPAERDTKYRVRRQFGPILVEEEERESPLDRIADAESVFGSYDKLTQEGQFRFHLKRAPNDAV